MLANTDCMCLIVSRSWLADVMLTRWSLEFGISIELCIGMHGLVAFDFDRIRSLRSISSAGHVNMLREPQ